MASTKAYLDYILDNLDGLIGVSFRAMMGEYIIYYEGKIVGGIYDDRLLLKPTPLAVSLTSSPIYELPYEGAKPMLLIKKTDDKVLLKNLIKTVASELPIKKVKR